LNPERLISKQRKLTMSDEGTICYHNPEKLFYFIRPDQDAPDVYCHISKFPPDQIPERGDRVRYSAAPGRQPGRLAATRAEIVR
jgi:cold shock CspA family protein